MVSSGLPSPFSLDLVSAKAGDREALVRLTETCRPYLLRIANDELDSGLRVKCGASDLVQVALFEGQRAFHQFLGANESDLLAWLRRILRNNLIDEARRYLEGSGRDFRIERSMDAEEGSALRGALQYTQISPLEALVLLEKQQAMETGLERLPAESRRAIEMRHLEEKSFAQIGEALGKSEEAARKIWFRALTRLREELNGDEHSRSSPE